MKTNDVKLSIGRIHRTAEEREIQLASQTHDCGLRLRGAFIRPHQKNLGAIITEMNERIVKWSHARSVQPDLTHARGIDGMRNPRERCGNGRGVLLLWLKKRQESVILIVADDVQRRGWNVVPLLVARRNQAGARMHAEEGHAQTPSQLRHVFSVG